MQKRRRRMLLFAACHWIQQQPFIFKYFDGKSSFCALDSDTTRNLNIEYPNHSCHWNMNLYWFVDDNNFAIKIYVTKDTKVNLSLAQRVLVSSWVHHIFDTLSRHWNAIQRIWYFILSQLNNKHIDDDRKIARWKCSHSGVLWMNPLRNFRSINSFVFYRHRWWVFNNPRLIVANSRFH